jgi:ADP-glucose pyrophosphorylase
MCAQPDPAFAAWLEFLRLERNEPDILPASQRLSDHACARTADGLSNIDIIESYDQIHRHSCGRSHLQMDYEPMLKQHVEQNADVTIKQPRR